MRVAASDELVEVALTSGLHRGHPQPRGAKRLRPPSKGRCFRALRFRTPSSLLQASN